MIVPTMTPSEVYREVMRDFDSVESKARNQSIILQAELKRKKLNQEIRVITYKTARFNEWHLVLKICRDRIYTMYYLRSSDSKGLVTYSLQFNRFSNERFLVKTNAHFFKRYNERMQLNLDEPKAIIKHFFRNNFETEQAQSEVLQNGKRLIHLSYECGIGIGWLDDEDKVMQLKTFIAANTLSKKHQSLVDYLKSHNDDEEFTTVLNLKHMRNEI